IGYTNAGKSNLLNTLTHSQVAAENRLFMTLDPTSRRLKFPRNREVIITDTVGFIRDLPRELKVAFRATLEELESADLFVHVVDISDSRYPDHIESVNGILSELRLESTPVLFALNKQDRVEADTARKIVRQTGGILMSANNSDTLNPFITALTDRVEQLTAVSARQRRS
ncbi:MAG: GTPase, partial [Desulfosudaceae bacterium]